MLFSFHSKCQVRESCLKNLDTTLPCGYKGVYSNHDYINLLLPVYKLYVYILIFTIRRPRTATTD